MEGQTRSNHSTFTRENSWGYFPFPMGRFHAHGFHAFCSPFFLLFLPLLFFSFWYFSLEVRSGVRAKFLSRFFGNMSTVVDVEISCRLLNRLQMGGLWQSRQNSFPSHQKSIFFVNFYFQKMTSVRSDNGPDNGPENIGASRSCRCILDFALSSSASAISYAIILSNQSQQRNLIWQLTNTQVSQSQGGLPVITR